MLRTPRSHVRVATLVELRRQDAGAGVLAAPRSRIVSRVFVAWPFDDGAPSANDSTHAQPGARGHLFDIAAEEPIDLRD